MSSVVHAQLESAPLSTEESNYLAGFLSFTARFQ